MDEIKVVPLGAGQDVGRSCILLSMGGKNIMFDCGMHMGFNDDRRFPDFSYIIKDGKLHTVIDCVIISHFHLDHCGALPYMSEMVGYDGPIYMTHPTKAMCPILLEDFRKVAVERKGEQNFFTAEMIKSCMKKVIAVNLHQTVKVDDRLSIKAYYAGHVLGAAMFHVKVGSQTVVYTGDYNMTPDRHLGAAWIDQCQPDLLISESTYATTIRDSKRCRERDFLKKVHDCVEKNGKVLIPVFALGRAQELCILLETYWDRMNLKAPIYFTGGLTEKANQYYKLFITWTNQKIKNTFVQRNMFDFRHIKPFERALMDNPGPMVVFATPGMLHGGMSLQIFKKWCTNENNTIIMPGYCVAGTVGWKILNGQRKLEFENKQIVDVKMSVQYMSFSAHADAKGIMQLIRHCQPKNVMLVHGEEIKMEFLKGKVLQEFNIPCLMPANGETAIIPTYHNIPIELSMNVLKRSLLNGDDQRSETDGGGKQRRTITAALMLRQDRELPQLCAVQDCMKELNLPEHQVRFSSSVAIDDELSSNQIVSKLAGHLKDRVKAACVSAMTLADEGISISDSVLIKVESNGDDVQKQIMVSWSLQDENIGSQLLAAIRDYSYTFAPAVKCEK